MPTIASRIRRARVNTQNWFRRRRKLPPYIVIDLDGEISDFPAPAPPLPRFIAKRLPIGGGGLSISELKRTFEQIAADDRVQGVVLRIECAASGAIYQSLRGLLPILQDSGKKVIAYANHFGPYQYYLACACDQIIMPPSAEWAVLGMHQEYVFLKDALDQVGVQFEVVNVSPFKSAGDQVTRNDFSEESRAQAEWLLSAFFDELVAGIAKGRKLPEARVRELIDTGPFVAADAVKHGLIDAALYEDELEYYLLGPIKADEMAIDENAKLRRFFVWLQQKLKRNESQATSDASIRNPQSLIPTLPPDPRLILLDEARKALLVPHIEFASKFIGIVGVEGMIVEGKSQNAPVPLPIFGSKMAGSDSIAQALRKAEQDDKLAAVILYVNSQGGSALASDLIAREVRRVMKKKPVVVYMSSVAASGGYFVAALAKHIVAQPLTVTGSIGVIITKPNTGGVDEKLRLHRAALQRGARAGMMTISRPFSPDERDAVKASMSKVYDDFKRVVAEGRTLDFDALEPICGGRVWTGAMAHERKLVDTLGGFSEAMAQARALAGLQGEVDTGKRVGAMIVQPPKEWQLPPMFPINPAQWVTHSLQFWRKHLAHTATWLLLPWESR
ncbi:MAG: S49 family peptidase [Chloroflexi bacterium]|nr:S49 family peptidase [Chloroflexota bacterium]